MKASTREWVTKAEGDFFLAANTMKSRSRLVSDGVCFHCQQCIEKYFKARLLEAGISSPKTHDLSDLLILLLPIEPLWAPWAPTLNRLSYYAVQFRYPGSTASRADARKALKNCRAIRKEARLSLGLPAK